MVAEHTKSRGLVGVVGGGGDCSGAARGVVSPIASLKVYFQNHTSNAHSLLSSPRTKAELGLAEELPLIPLISVYTHWTFAHFWADPPNPRARAHTHTHTPVAYCCRCPPRPQQLFTHLSVSVTIILRICLSHVSETRQ